MSGMADIGLGKSDVVATNATVATGITTAGDSVQTLTPEGAKQLADEGFKLRQNFEAARASKIGEFPDDYRGPRDWGNQMVMYGGAPDYFNPYRPPYPISPTVPDIIFPLPVDPVPADSKPVKPGPDVMPKPAHGYHRKKIVRGTLGEPSKIREELEEYEDAVNQGIEIMAHLELADLYGALAALASKHGLEMRDLAAMSEATERAFKLGHRK